MILLTKLESYALKQNQNSAFC